MYLQCAAHFVVSEYIKQTEEIERAEQNVKILMCILRGPPLGDRHTYYHQFLDILF